jgi:glycosyltransferase involved in cell wall biosynthesis
MKIRILGYDPISNSGPFSFTRQLIKGFTSRKHQLVETNADATLSVIVTNSPEQGLWVLRLDGIHFDSARDIRKLNEPIRLAYQKADVVVAQSEFNRKLIEHTFENHLDLRVIPNGVDLQEIRHTRPIESFELDRFDTLWCCAAEWRAHKRLDENIRFFLEHAGPSDALLVAGHGVEHHDPEPRIVYLGIVDRMTLLSIYKRSQYFLHLAFCDHCPNVVLDARASGCHIICTSSGGTHEIAGRDATIIEDIEWAGMPLDLQHPPALDFSKTSPGSIDSPLDIIEITKRYESALTAIS